MKFQFLFIENVVGRQKVKVKVKFRKKKKGSAESAVLQYACAIANSF